MRQITESAFMLSLRDSRLLSKRLESWRYIATKCQNTLLTNTNKKITTQMLLLTKSLLLAMTTTLVILSE
ncbi:hypothetical protein [Helicobacter sp. T3_23-1059]